MVTFKLIQLYPGSKPLGYILKPVNNGLTKPDNYYQNGIWFNPSDYPKYWQEVKELSLLEEAKLRYPIGTKFKSILSDKIVEIKDHNLFKIASNNLTITYDYGLIIVHNGEGWSEIVDDFVLPEKWCIKQNTAKEVCDWFNKNGTNTANINGTWTYLNYPCIVDYYSNKINPGFTEITFEQFKKYVLKEEAAVEKDYEILSVITNNNKFIEKVYNQDATIEPYWKIHSVKRLSDSEIFTIGDKVVTEYVNYTINKIDIVNDKCMVTALYDTNNPNGSRLHYNLNNLKKAKQPIFQTEDGVDIFEGDNLYSIDNMLNIRKHLLFNARYDDNTLLNNRIFFNSDYKHFSTKEKAEEYILMNKPLLSLSDVWDNLKVKDQKEVMKFVKSKLNK